MKYPDTCVVPTDLPTIETHWHHNTMKHPTMVSQVYCHDCRIPPFEFRNFFSSRRVRGRPRWFQQVDVPRVQVHTCEEARVLVWSCVCTYRVHVSFVPNANLNFFVVNYKLISPTHSYTVYIFVYDGEGVSCTYRYARGRMCRFTNSPPFTRHINYYPTPWQFLILYL
jgi:hypothetical protein